MRGLNEIQKLKLGDARGTPSKYFKKSQASKLGMLRIPPLFVNYRLDYVEPKFLFVHMMRAILGVLFFFCLLFNKILKI